MSKFQVWHLRPGEQDMGEKGCFQEGELAITIVYLIHCLKEINTPPLFRALWV